MPNEIQTTVVYYKRNDRPFRAILMTKGDVVLSRSGDFNPDIDIVINKDEYSQLVKDRSKAVKDKLEQAKVANKLVEDEGDKLAESIIGKLTSQKWKPLTDDEAHFLAYRVVKLGGR